MGHGFGMSLSVSGSTKLSPNGTSNFMMFSQPHQHLSLRLLLPLPPGAVLTLMNIACRICGGPTTHGLYHTALPCHSFGVSYPVHVYRGNKQRGMGRNGHIMPRATRPNPILLLIRNLDVRNERTFMHAVKGPVCEHGSTQ